MRVTVRVPVTIRAGSTWVMVRADLVPVAIDAGLASLMIRVGMASVAVGADRMSVALRHITADIQDWHTSVSVRTLQMHWA